MSNRWKRWMHKLHYTERIGVFLDGKLVAIQEIRRRKVMVVDANADYEFRVLPPEKIDTPDGISVE